MNNNNKNNEIFKELFTEFMIENYGERCHDYDKNCSTCQAWDNFDVLFTKLESGDDVYEYRTELLNMYDIEVLKGMSKSGWNVCASTHIPDTPSNLNTLFYFRKKL